MNEKILIVVLAFGMGLIACPNKKVESSDKNQSSCESDTIKFESVQKEKKDSTEQRLIKSMLKEFYTQYLKETCSDGVRPNLNKRDSIVRKYNTDQSINQWDDPELGYDLFVDANYCEEDWVNRLSFRADSMDNSIYVVSWTVDTEEKQKIIRLRVLKDTIGYKIDEILVNQHYPLGD